MQYVCLACVDGSGRRTRLKETPGAKLGAWQQRGVLCAPFCACALNHLRRAGMSTVSRSHRNKVRYRALLHMSKTICNELAGETATHPERLTNQRLMQPPHDNVALPHYSSANARSITCRCASDFIKDLIRVEWG